MSGPLGSFDSGFYGISLVFSDSESVRRSTAYVQAASIAEWNAGSGPAELHTIGMLSTPDHEARHFHDFLLSPFGAAIMALRIEATVNGVQALKSIIEAPHRHIPTPMRRWLEWDEGERRDWVKETGSYFGIDGIDDFISLPTPSQRRLTDRNSRPSLENLSQGEVLALTAEGGFMAFSAMAQLREPIDFDLGVDPISPDAIFEATAHIVQAQAVWRGQGEAATAEYMKLLEGDSISSLASYNHLRLALQEHSPNLDIRRLSELFTWMLLGHPDQLKEMGNPAARYVAVLMLALRNPEILLVDASTERLWEALDRLTGSNWRDNLRQSLADFDARQRKYDTLREQLEGELFEAIFDTADLWVKESKQVIEAVLADPESYVIPLKYLTEMAGKLPFPFVRQQFGSAIHRRDEPLRSDTIVAITSEKDPRDVIAYVVAPSPLGTKDADSVILAMRASFYVDYCFFSEPPDSLLNHLMENECNDMLSKELVHIY
jgi:hypothetical protein